MPLPPAAPRAPIHTREVECRGYRRTDGLWDIEARMADKKGYAVHNDHRTVDAGDPFHDMALRVTVDDTLMIHRIDACIDAAPHRICPFVTPNFQHLLVLRIEPGFRHRPAPTPRWRPRMHPLGRTVRIACNDSNPNRESAFAVTFRAWMAPLDRCKSTPVMRCPPPVR